MDRMGTPNSNKTPWQVFQYLVRRYFWGSTVAWSAWVAPTALIDRTYPAGVVIARGAWIGPYALILTHDMSRGMYLNTRIGERSVIGARAVIMPGVTVGNDCVIDPGAVVSRDVPSGQRVAGNPARPWREGA
jgi:acetyltransferase-like isoleucine patch superfamily enzyme